MKAIIFGSNGQDGSHLAELLLEKGYEVVGVIRRTSNDSTLKLKGVLNHENFSIAEADITDSASVGAVFRIHADAKEVYNLAAQSHVGVSFKQPAVTWDITGKGCLNILQSMVDLKVDARFYQASSSEMFGSSYTWQATPDMPPVGHSLSSPMGREVMESGEGRTYQDEDTRFLPQSPYAIAKCAAHYMTRLFREGHNMHASAGILFNHEGPRRGETFVTRKITKWIGDYEAWLLSHLAFCQPHVITCNKTDTLIINPNDEYGKSDLCKRRGSSFPKLRLGNLDASRDWGYAGDYVEAMWMMLQKDQPDDYVICTGETHTIKEFLEIAFDAAYAELDDWSKYVVIDPEFYRPAEVDYLRGDNTKARTKLGWTPKHSFQDLVKLMVKNDEQ